MSKEIKPRAEKYEPKIVTEKTFAQLIKIAANPKPKIEVKKGK